MCGIAGIVSRNYNSNLVNYDSLEKMESSIKHRGPDGKGFFVDKQVGFTHRRLSILDLSKEGSQPMSSIDGNYIISFNGEIYNHQEIRKRLIKKNHSFKSKSDTETILLGYMQFGKDLFKMLNGIFAFSIYDKIQQKVILVRDRLGVKPLYYHLSNDHLVFSSEKKAILKVSSIRTIDYNSLNQFLYYGYAHKNQTLFSGIKKVLPGHALEVNLGNFEINNWAFWKHEDMLPINYKISEKEAVNRTKILLENAVKRQLQSDVPVGIFLSGGIDSSAITAFASKHYDNKLKTYSASFDYNEGHNELDLAKKVANKFNTDHHEFHIRGADLPDITERLVMHHDEPFSDAANIPLYLMSLEIKSECPVILQGDGGDELFGGYPRYHLLSKRDRYKFVMQILRPITKLPFKLPLIQKVKRYQNIFTDPPNEALANLLTLESKESMPHSIFSKEINIELSKHDPFNYYTELYERFDSLTCLDQKMMWIDSLIILPDLFLEKVDKSTMANSIEVRVPFLDNELVEFAFSLPSQLKLKKGIKKYLLKKALRGIIPNTILDGRKKGFGVPFGNWLKGPLYNHFNDMVFSTFIKNIGVFDLDEIQKLTNEHKKGEQDHSQRLWKVYNLAMWLEKYNIAV